MKLSFRMRYHLEYSCTDLEMYKCVTVSDCHFVPYNKPIKQVAIACGDKSPLPCNWKVMIHIIVLNLNHKTLVMKIYLHFGMTIVTLKTTKAAWILLLRMKMIIMGETEKWLTTTTSHCYCQSDLRCSNPVLKSSKQHKLMNELQSKGNNILLFWMKKR